MLQFLDLCGQYNLKSEEEEEEVLKEVKARVEADPTLVNARDDVGNSALSFAAFAGNPKIVYLLVQKGASVNTSNSVVRRCRGPKVLKHTMWQQILLAQVFIYFTLPPPLSPCPLPFPPHPLSEWLDALYLSPLPALPGGAHHHCVGAPGRPQAKSGGVGGGHFEVLVRPGLLAGLGGQHVLVLRRGLQRRL